MRGAIRDTWGSLGWENGWLGFPTRDEYPVADKHSVTNEHAVTARSTDARRGESLIPGRIDRLPTPAV